MDEYERAAAEIKSLIGRIPEDDYLRIVDSETKDDDCRSVQTIMSHVVRSGYGYADYLRKEFSIDSENPGYRLLDYRETGDKLDEMLRYTARTLEGRWEMSREEILGTVMTTPRGATLHLEALLQHAIVHILRHRRQIEKFTWQRLITIS